MKKGIDQGWLSLKVGLAVTVQIALLLGAARAFSAPQRLGVTFRKGDAVRLIVWQPWSTTDGKNDRVDLNGDYLIDNRGYIFLPLLGDVKVIGHTTTTLAELLKEKLSSYIQDPVVVVEPLIRVTVLGAFRRPGTYLVKPDVSFWQLVALAGGPTEESNLKKFSVQRGGKVVRKNLLSGFENAYSIQELGIRSGDQVFLPEKKKFQIRDALEILRFGISILNLYLLIDRINK